jgi:hypothetical protein
MSGLSSMPSGRIASPKGIVIDGNDTKPSKDFS